MKHVQGLDHYKLPESGEIGKWEIVKRKKSNPIIRKLVFWWYTIIHNMRDNRRKHKILKVLDQKKTQGELRSGPGLEVTPVGKSLTANKIHTITGYSLREIEVPCTELVKSEHLELIDYTPEHQYLINNRGILAIMRRDFLSKIWYRSWDFWKWVAPSLFSLIALLNGVFKWW